MTPVISRITTLLVLVLLAVPAAWAVEPNEVLDDPVLEQRARAISANLRCLVCQNQSIDDSDAELARDLRVLVRERLVAGDTDSETVDYIVDRYGEFVLLKPVFALHTLLLWAFAPLVLVVGLGTLFIVARRRDKSPGSSSEMTEDEKAALARLTDSDQ